MSNQIEHPNKIIIIKKSKNRNGNSFFLALDVVVVVALHYFFYFNKINSVYSPLGIKIEKKVCVCGNYFEL